MEEILKLALEISDDLKVVKAKLLNREKSPIDQLKESWIDTYDLTQTLHICKRAVQTLRTSGQLPYTIFNSKCWYKVSDLEAMLESNYSNHQNTKQ